MPHEEPPQDRLALCGTCWMFTGIFVLVLGMVLTALGYIEHHILGFRITGPCFIGASSIMLTAASACCVSAHRRGQPKPRRRPHHHSQPNRQISSNHEVHSPSCPHYRPPSTTSHTQDRQSRNQTVTRVEVAPPVVPQQQANTNPLAGLRFVSPPRQQRRAAGVSDEETMSSDYDNVPKTRRGRNSRRNGQLFTFAEVEVVNERSALIGLEPGQSETQDMCSVSSVLSTVAEAEDTNAEPPPSYEDVMAHSP